MTINLDGANAILGILAALTALIGGGFMVLRYVIRAETSELRNNGGFSIKDRIERIDNAATLAAQKAEVAAHMATATKGALDDHIEQSAQLIEQGKVSEQEIRGTIATLAEAVKIAAQSTPPEEHSPKA